MNAQERKLDELQHQADVANSRAKGEAEKARTLNGKPPAPSLSEGELKADDPGDARRKH